MLCGRRRPLLHRTPYAATKMALTGFVRSLALEVGQDDITVNTVSPGYVEGERIKWVMAAQAEAQGITPEEVRANVLAQSPVGSLVAPESVGRTVVFLADRPRGTSPVPISMSPRASGWTERGSHLSRNPYDMAES